MQAVSTSSLFQSAESEALGGLRAHKAKLTAEGAQYGYPIQLNPNFDAAALASEGAGADGGRFRVLSTRVTTHPETGASHVWTGEAGGVVRQTDLEGGKPINTYKGAKGPVPSFDFLTDKMQATWLVSGSWDKALRFYQISKDTLPPTKQAPALTIEGAMDDFIKCVHVFYPSKDSTLLAVGGSDKSIKIFDISPLVISSGAQVTADQIRCVHQSRSHTRPINAISSLSDADGLLRLYSADSMGRVLEYTWDATTQRLYVSREILGFETAVYDLRVFWAREEVEGDDNTQSKASDAFITAVKESEDGSRFRRVAMLWGASGDKSAAGYRLSPPAASSSGGRDSAATALKRPTSLALLGDRPPLTTPFVKIAHRDYVKSVLPLSLFLAEHPELVDSTTLAALVPDSDVLSTGVVTAGSDDHLRYFPDPPKAGQSSEDHDVYELGGHWNEVTSLVSWVRPPSLQPCTTGTDSEGQQQQSALPSSSQEQSELWIVSAGLDGSVRRWPVSQLTLYPKPAAAPSISNAAPTNIHASEHWTIDSVPDIKSGSRLQPDDAPIQPKAGGIQMTAEEEAELAELMDSDGDE
ncbi:WD40 repeat-like protein [Testicularia cyperi]|uniref:WD40 repeat-like protein n=1 Tax=Testicularia cyperi TaxID=1882483 RepID=A0A317XRY7_9BASI|nr:WD40 repeat-like protein [Testicularia cyperi]